MLKLIIKKTRFIIAFGKYTIRFKHRKKLLMDGRFKCEWKDRYACLEDITKTTTFDPHYVYHTAWAARILSRLLPNEHVDIGSCFRFVTLISAFIPIKFFDYRPVKTGLLGLESGYADITALPFPDNSIESLSCMHVAEHIGLERYGDPFDPKGDIIAMHELQRVLMPGGYLLFVVPIGGVARIQYNAHRIYTVRQILNYFNTLKLVDFSLIKDDGNFESPSNFRTADAQNYGCGCFMFIKPTDYLDHAM
ncbi:MULTISPECIES: DUF268 domain-containing protein [Methylomonas]|nr:DUF268 domain-containing protein [Methylomonas koyamae]